MRTMNTSKLLHKNTILLLAIFLVGVVVAVMYINATFASDSDGTTATPTQTEKVAFHS